MSGALIEFSGSYGSFKVCASTGVVMEHSPDRAEIAAEGGFGYLDVVRVDLNERRAWYAARGVILPDVQPDGDILDVGHWTALDGYVEAPRDYREEIIGACYPHAASEARS